MFITATQALESCFEVTLFSLVFSLEYQDQLFMPEKYLTFL